MGSVEEAVEAIHAWSAPRSLSTSLMYSFAQSDDTEVLDEPLYATFLKSTGAARPCREQVLSSMEADEEKVVKDVIFGPGRKKYRFCKPSFDKVVPPSFFELGLAELVSVYSDLWKLGSPPPVIDAADLEQNPEATLRGLCEDLDIPFQSSMLSWEAGPKAYDGVWAPWWYKSVHESTCFAKVRKYPMPFPFGLYDLLEEVLPLYNVLKHRVKRSSNLLKSPLPAPDLPVPENEKLLAWVGDEILPRDSAKVSVFDSVVQGGNSVWEGLRVYDGKVFSSRSI
ncbi:unnamed protein product [Linum trigynum]|uniref:Uncharacterized protein n=1 Tax=Linum trigynum TaxID=586398 RepID=A0AAV2F9N1_9ROSI